MGVEPWFLSHLVPIHYTDWTVPVSYFLNNTESELDLIPGIDAEKCVMEILYT
jgi:hypothetical protein